VSTVHQTEDRLLDAAGVAEILNVSPRWVMDAGRAGVLPSVKLKQWRRYRRSAILAWLEQAEKGGNP
jgi:predicted DNA-binding transcriptional regulator AlpA